MQISKIEKFVAIRVIIFFAVLAVLNLIFINQRWLVLGGLLVGGLFSLVRFRSLVSVFVNVIAGTGKKKAVKKTVLNYIINQFITFVLLFIAIKISIWFFWGAAAGVLLVHFVIFITCIVWFVRGTQEDF